MNTAFRNGLAVLLTSLLISFAAFAGGGQHEHHVIKIKTGDADLIETDLHDLEIGESKTIVTDSGKTVDLIRSAEGVEVYIDGELMDFNGALPAGAKRVQVIDKRVEVVCDEDEECDDMVWVHADGDYAYDIESMHGTDAPHQVIVIEKQVEHVDSD